MSIVIQHADRMGPYSEDMSEFERDMARSGVAVVRESSESGVLYFDSGVAHSLAISVDPHTLKLIFGYIVGLTSAYKGADLARAFLKAATKKLGDITGAQLAAIIAALWKRIILRGTELAAKDPRDKGVVLRIESRIDYAGLSITSSYSPLRNGCLSEPEAEAAVSVLFVVVLPLAKEFVQLLKGRDAWFLDPIRIQLSPPERSESPLSEGQAEDWSWHVGLGHTLVEVSLDGKARVVNDVFKSKEITELMAKDDLQFADVEIIAEANLRP